MRRKLPTSAIILLIVLGLRFSSLTRDLTTFQWEGNHWYNQSFSPFSFGVNNTSTILMNGRPSIQSLLSDRIANIVSREDESRSASIRRPRILLGISTKDYLDKSERQHRRIIRDTWLDSQFHEGKSDESSHSVCSMHELLIASREDSDGDCQLVYTFLFPNRENQTTKR